MQTLVKHRWSFHVVFMFRVHLLLCLENMDLCQLVVHCVRGCRWQLERVNYLQIELSLFYLLQILEMILGTSYNNNYSKPTLNVTQGPGDSMS